MFLRNYEMRSHFRENTSSNIRFNLGNTSQIIKEILILAPNLASLLKWSQCNTIKIIYYQTLVENSKMQQPMKFRHKIRLVSASEKGSK